MDDDCQDAAATTMVRLREPSCDARCIHC
jgi:hypothetical protein